MAEVPRGSERVVLVGLRGSGKTAVAQVLGAQLGWEVIDTDTEVERRLGPIWELFAAGREAEFRREEQRQVANALERSPAVIATGGGAVVAEATRSALRDELCVWLWADPEVLVTRTRGSQRPPLTALDELDEVWLLLTQRWRAYAEVADIAIDTGRADTESAARMIAAVWTVRR
jgi:shikimate kinase